MKELLKTLLAGTSLTIDQTIKAFELIMTGQAGAAEVGALLMLIQQRGATVDELTGAATVMRRKVTAVEVPAGLTVVDTCGTGGDHTSTFNISTAAALVTAAVGRPKGVVVAKHGNRTITRASGSSQGLEALGVHLDVNVQALTRCLDEAGICFCFAPAHHPAMKYAMPIRMELGVPTIFNLLGPLTNPAGASRQVIGVADKDLTQPIATVLGRLGCKAAMVLHGKKQSDVMGPGFCEASVCGPTQITQLADGKIETFEIHPADLGLGVSDIEALLVDGPDSSARVIRSVLAGEQGPARDVVCANASVAMVIAGLAGGLAEGVSLAAEAIDRGAASAALNSLINLTQACNTAAS